MAARVTSDRCVGQGKKAVVCGGGGFIGGHLVNSLLASGAEVIRAVDVKPFPEWYQRSEGVENLVLDLKDKEIVFYRDGHVAWPRGYLMKKKGR